MAYNGKQLIDALQNRKYRDIERFLQDGWDPNQLGYDGVSPMHLAAGLGMKEVCMLLQHGGDPNIRSIDETGTTPVHIAAMWGEPDCLQILLANGGDPFLEDQQDGSNALDLAQRYNHPEITQVLERYMALLNQPPEETITPKYTYTRRSTGSSASFRSESPELTDTTLNMSAYNTQQLHEYLQEFTKRRRSSMYLRSVQSQMNKYFTDGQKTHMIDVTSPDHPYIEPKYGRDGVQYETTRKIPEHISPAQHYSPFQHEPLSPVEESLHLHLSVSGDEQSTSCDSFVTCDGEDLDTVLQKDQLNKSFDEDEESDADSQKLFNTVIKNRKFVKDSNLDSNSDVNQSSNRDLNQSSNSDLNQSSRTLSRNQPFQRRIVKDSQLDGDSDVNQSSNSDVNQSSSTLLRTQPFQRRKDKYCRRVPLFQPPETQDLISVQCDLCGRNSQDVSCIQSSGDVVCRSCQKLSQELDGLLEDRSYQVKTVKTLSRDSGNGHDQRNKHSFFNKLSDERNERNITEKSHVSDIDERTVFENINSNLGYKQNKREIFENVNNNHGHKQNVDELVYKLRQSSLHTNPKISVHNIPFNSKHQDRNSKPHDWNNDSLISSDESFLIPGDDAVKAEFHPSDISTITVEDWELDSDRNNAFLRISNTKDTTKSTLTDTRSSKEEKKLKSVMKVKDEATKPGQNKTISIQDRPPKKTSPDYVDLWDQVRAQTSKRKQLLDTGFIGRESLTSFHSDATTVEYVYKDPENGIALIERHIPSVCGSVGSRRSLDSQLSVGSKASSGRNSGTSEDTEIYDWREEAMCEGYGDAAASSVRPKTTAVRPELKKLDNDTIRTKLCNLGDDPGPVTSSTRQTYLTRLSQLENDPDAKLITRKSPGYPTELQNALHGNLDLTNMAVEEDRMFAAFQNPNRHQRWREGTLKSSFNYILLDPRITKNLPSRACNMTDLDVLQCFISAIFYVGKGKRARPYCHLYEAIKHMQKPKDKVSSKVTQILEIWSSGLGVVSLHCFQSVIPVEAYTREACMVDAIGLNKLTNMKRGDYYGISVTNSMKQRRKMGVYLLTKALQIFLAEGERQISPLDIKTDCVCPLNMKTKTN